jgi:hypothetical protein
VAGRNAAASLPRLSCVRVGERHLSVEELRLIEDHLGLLDHQMADLLGNHQAAMQRLAEGPGMGVDWPQQTIAEVGATAATFPSPKASGILATVEDLSTTAGGSRTRTGLTI